MRKTKNFPKLPVAFLVLIAAVSIFAGILAPYDAQEMNPQLANLAPSAAHIFGTDNLGRDLFSMVLYGGRASLYIGIFSGLISTAAAVIYGTVCGLAGERIDDMLMRLAELLMSIPSILLIIFLQALWGQATYTSLSVMIGLTGWMQISKVVRSEVKQIRGSDYILAARTMGAGFWYLLRRHLLPGLVSPIMFMAVTNIGQAMITESTLSFLGLGLPLSEMSWGGLLSMSQEALLSDKWWILLIPGTVLILTLLSITSIGEYVRRKNVDLNSNL